MARAHQAEFGLDTGMFSVHQLHPEAALRYAGSAAMAALAQHGRSLQRLITEHHTGLVISSDEVTYLGPLTFFTAPCITSESTVRLRDDGKLLVFDVRHRVNGQDAVAVRVGARPVKLSGGPALDATPAAVDERVRALFLPDETAPAGTMPARSLRGLISRATSGAEELGGGEVPLFIGRNDCEIADQWLHSRLPSLVAAAREQLLMDGMSDLAVCAEKPIAKFHSEFFRPMYFGDHGSIKVTVYRNGGAVHAVHRVLGALPPGAAEEDRPLSALALETF